MKAAWITVEDIKRIYAIPDGIDPEAFIDQAHVLVSESIHLPYTHERKKIIELYIAVHLIHTYEPQSTSYQGMQINHASLGEFLQASFYGQQALIFDTEGYLRGLGQKKARLWSCA